MAVTLFWQLVLLYSASTSAFPNMARELAPRLAAVSNTSSASTGCPNIVVGGISKVANETPYCDSSSSTNSSSGSTTTTVPMVNSPIVLPWFSECTSGDTGTATFTSEFAHHTGYETIAEDQAFWNETYAVWVVKVVSPGYIIQDFGLDIGDSVDPVDSSAISLDTANSTFAITVPTHACESTCSPLISSQSTITTTWMSAILRVSFVLQSQGLPLVGLSNPTKQHRSFPAHIHLVFQASILALRTRSLILQSVHTIRP